jgi:hypothetical protein
MKKNNSSSTSGSTSTTTSSSTSGSTSTTTSSSTTATENNKNLLNKLKAYAKNKGIPNREVRFKKVLNAYGKSYINFNEAKRKINAINISEGYVENLD